MGEPTFADVYIYNEARVGVTVARWYGVELVKVAENSYVFEGPSNMGVYVSDRECVIIDTGLGRDRARKLLRVLGGKGLTLRAVINTHCHVDHCGGNYFISKRTGVEFYAPRDEIPFIEKPELHLRSLYGLAYPPRDHTIRLLLGDNCYIHHPVVEGALLVGNHRFSAVALPGHSPGQLGIVAEDGVIFAGDALFARQILDKHPIPFYPDPEETVKSAQKLAGLNVDFVVLGHGPILRREEAVEHIEYYVNRVKAIEEATLGALSTPLSTEEVVSKVAAKFKVEGVMLQYLLASSTIKGHLSSLVKRGLLTAKLEGFKVLWSKAQT